LQTNALPIPHWSSANGGDETLQRIAGISLDTPSEIAALAAVHKFDDVLGQASPSASTPATTLAGLYYGRCRPWSLLQTQAPALSAVQGCGFR